MTQTVSPNHEIAIIECNTLGLLNQLEPQVQAPAVFMGKTSTSILPLLEDNKVEEYRHDLRVPKPDLQITRNERRGGAASN